MIEQVDSSSRIKVERFTDAKVNKQRKLGRVTNRTVSYFLFFYLLFSFVKSVLHRFARIDLQTISPANFEESTLSLLFFFCQSKS